MPLKIQLATTSEVLNCTPDPEGLNDFELELKRSQFHDGVFYEFGVNLKFFKEGRRLIRDVYEAQGIDGRIECRIFQYDASTYSYQKIYTGQLRLQDYEIDEIGVQINIEQDSEERTFINNIKKNIAVPTNDLITVPPRNILQRFKGTPSSSDDFVRNSALVFNFTSNNAGQSRSAKAYVMIDVGNREFAEFEGLENGGLSYEVSEYDAVPFLRVSEAEQGKYDFDFVVRNAFNITGRLVSGGDVDVGDKSTHTPPITIKLFFEIRDGDNTSIQKTQIGSTYDSTTAASNGFGNNEVITDFETRSYTAQGIDILPSYKLYLYYEIELSSNEFNVANQPAAVEYDIYVNADVGGTFDDWNVEFNAKTAYPETQVQITFPFEMFENLVTANTNGQLKFKSDFFARETFNDYDTDGDGALTVVTNGHKLRQAVNKRLFTNWQEAFESYSALYCLGWAFEQGSDGNKYVRIEKKEYFYNSEKVSFVFNQTKGLVKRAKKDLYYTRVEVGYPEYENIGVTNNGSDEFNSKRTYTTDIKQADNELKLLSTFRASCHEIESQRRQELNNEANKLDDENFWLYLRRSSQDGTLYVQTGSNYIAISGVFDKDSLFNIGIRPSLFVENWRPVLSSVTYRKDNKAYNFASGTLNYEMSVIGVAEDRDFTMSNSDAFYLCEEIEFEAGLNFRQRKKITDNPTGLIEVKDWVGNSVLGFVLTTKTVLEENKASIILLRATKKKLLIK